jgi:hypothetical protein
MKIKYKTRAAGPSGIRGIGDIEDLPEEMAKRLVDGGYAEALEPFRGHEQQITTPRRKAARK